MEYIIKEKPAVRIDARTIGLPRRHTVVRIAETHFALVKDRKSRSIMKDGITILRQIAIIHSCIPEVKISIATNAPMCRKTGKLFAEQGVELLSFSKK